MNELSNASPILVDGCKCQFTYGQVLLSLLCPETYTLCRQHTFRKKDYFKMIACFVYDLVDVLPSDIVINRLPIGVFCYMMIEKVESCKILREFAKHRPLIEKEAILLQNYKCDIFHYQMVFKRIADLINNNKRDEACHFALGYSHLATLTDFANCNPHEFVTTPTTTTTQPNDDYLIGKNFYMTDEFLSNQVEDLIHLK